MVSLELIPCLCNPLGFEGLGLTISSGLKSTTASPEMFWFKGTNDLEVRRGLNLFLVPGQAKVIV